MASLDVILQIAEEVRREQPVQSVGSCQFVSAILAERLMAVGLNAVRVVGYYVEARNPDDHATVDPFGAVTETRTRYDGVWMHWWVECEGFVVDVTADQVGKRKRAQSVVVMPKDKALAYCERLPTNPSHSSSFLGFEG